MFSPIRQVRTRGSQPGNGQSLLSQAGDKTLTGSGDPTEVLVHGMGAGGEGVGTLPDGRVVFLPRTAPGDRVLVRILLDKPRWARGEVVRRLEDGPGRCPPPCGLFKTCDGCSLQHLAYPEQLRIKGSLVGETLRRIGGFDLADPVVEPSPKELRYRNKMTFTLRRLQGGRVVAGLRELGHQGRVLDISSECLLPGEDLAEAWVGTRDAWGPGASLLPGGREIRLTLRSEEEGVALLVRGGKGNGDPSSILERVPSLRSIWREGKDGSVRSVAGASSLRVPWLQESLEVPGGGFLQVNRESGELVHRWVRGILGDVTGKKIVDAFCGVGSLGRVLARDGADVVGIEMDPSGVAVARGLQTPGFRIIQGLVEEELAKVLPADAVILNPPRKGLGPEVPATLGLSSVGSIVYVSCDPATLARDLARLGDPYEIEEVRAFDLFPQTAHVETVVSLRRKDV